MTDVLRGTWANASGRVSYVFDGKGKGVMRRGTYGREIAYAISENSLRLSFPSSVGSVPPRNFTFDIEGNLLKIIVEGKTGAQRFYKKPNCWKPAKIMRCPCCGCTYPIRRRKDCGADMWNWPCDS